jgi:hypothetical protein
MAKSKRSKEPENVSFFGLELKKVSKDQVKKDLLCISSVSILAKLLLILITTVVFGSFIDLFDISHYFNYAALVAQGQLPYLDFSVEYPVLFLIPALLPLPPALITQDVWTYIYAYQIFMVVIDLLIASVVYLIALEISGRNKAYIAGLLYASAFSAAYFVITKYDAFPTFFLMLGLMLTIYGLKKGGYLSILLGFFAKIFPAVALPYTFMLNAEKTSLKDEFVDLIKVAVPVALILLILPLILFPDSIMAYLSASGSGLSVYVNTPTYTIHAVLLIFGINLAPELISYAMYAVMIILILYLLGVAYTKKIENRRNMLLFTLLTMCVAIFFTKFYSPQYIVWITPLLALFLATSFRDIVLFYALQIIAYIEFPLFWGIFYENTKYANEFGTFGWYIAVLFFAVKYLIVIYILYTVINSNSDFKKKLDFRNTEKSK